MTKGTVTGTYKQRELVGPRNTEGLGHMVPVGGRRGMGLRGTAVQQTPLVLCSASTSHPGSYMLILPPP